MHFSLCKSKNVFIGCGGAPHVHLWADARETHDLIILPKLTTKKLALETATQLLEILSTRKKEQERILSHLSSQLERINLPEEVLDTDPPSHPHLKRVK